MERRVPLATLVLFGTLFFVEGAAPSSGLICGQRLARRLQASCKASGDFTAIPEELCCQGICPKKLLRLQCDNWKRILHSPPLRPKSVQVSHRRLSAKLNRILEAVRRREGNDRLTSTTTVLVLGPEILSPMNDSTPTAPSRQSRVQRVSGLRKSSGLGDLSPFAVTTASPLKTRWKRGLNKYRSRAFSAEYFPSNRTVTIVNLEARQQVSNGWYGGWG